MSLSTPKILQKYTDFENTAAAFLVPRDECKKVHSEEEMNGSRNGIWVHDGI